MIYKDRQDAGRVLAKELEGKAQNGVILGLTRGGVVVAQEVASLLKLPLDIIVAQKVASPLNPEHAIGAVTHTGALYIDEELVKSYALSHAALEKIIEEKQKAASQKLERYRTLYPKISLANKVAILIDDGIATGASIRAAILAIKKEKPSKLIIAVPVASSATLADLQPLVDEIICPLQPRDFYAVSQAYERFEQVEDPC